MTKFAGQPPKGEYDGIEYLLQDMVAALGTKRGYMVLGMVSVDQVTKKADGEAVPTVRFAAVEALAPENKLFKEAKGLLEKAHNQRISGSSELLDFGEMEAGV